jgi:formylglycine-generating enzyme required for sulfatase activity
MKSTALLLLIISCFAFNLPHEKILNAKQIEKTFSKIKEGLYVNKTEVSNEEYRQFLNDVFDNNDTEKYNSILPDTNVWRGNIQYGEPFTISYLRHPAYKEYPVVGVTYENAIAYCLWLTQKYNNLEKRKFAKAAFRLPTREEWKLAANGGDSLKQYTWGTGFMLNSRKQHLCNYNDNVIADFMINKSTGIEETENEPRIRTKITSNVKSYYPSSFGMYNMCGNVAEMIAEKGIVKGGSYMDVAQHVRIASERNYTKSSADIGFRVVMDVLQN